MAKSGPKPYKADWTQVNKMCALHCTGEEIADMLAIDYDTLAKACKRDHKMQLSEYIRQKASTGKMSLRRTQFTTAMAGNPTMLVWLGKNWLGQKDKSEEESRDDVVSALAKAINNMPS